VADLGEPVMELAVELGRPVSFLILVVVMPFLYVLFWGKAIKNDVVGILLGWALVILYAMAWTRMEGFFKNYKTELSEFFFYRGHAFVMSVSFGWCLGVVVTVGGSLTRITIRYLKPSAFPESLNRLMSIWYLVTVGALVVCFVAAYVITEPRTNFLYGYVGCYLLGHGPIAISLGSVICYLLIRASNRNLKAEE
jgi:hypothetical protein